MKTAAKISAWLLAAAMPLLANPLISQKYTADPQPIIWNERLYVFASNDNFNPTSSGYNIFYYTLMSSDDMVNWTDHGEVFKVKRDMGWANQAYAPGAAVRNNKVYLYVPDGGSSIGVVYADKPEGPWTDPNKRTLISKSMPNCNVPWLFDPMAFVDTDGQAYLYFGGGDGESAGKNLRGIKLNENMTSVSGEAVTINSPCSFEAAYVHKRNSTYYFSYSTNFSSCSPKGGSAWIDYSTSSNPLNNYTYKGTVLSQPTVNNQNVNDYGNNHQGIIEYKNKWYAFYHDRRLKRANNVSSGEFRSVSVDLFDYNTDGTIKPVVFTNDGPPQIKNFNPYNTMKATMNKQSGIKTNDSISAAEGNIILDISNNDWIRLKGVDFGDGATGFTVRASSNNSSGGTIELRTGSQTGTLVGEVNITSTGSWNTWRDFNVNISGLTGVKDFLYLVFKGSGTELFRISSYKFSGAGSGGTSIGCNLNNLQPSYTGCNDIPRPNVTCSNGATGAASFSVSGVSEPIEEWNNAGGTRRFCSPGIRNVTLTSLVCGTTLVTPPSSPVNCGSFIVRSEPVECSYQTSYCGGKPFADVQDASDAVPEAGTCVYIENFEKIQPNLESTVAINGVENTCGTEWGEVEGKCPFNTKPPAIDGGYYVYVKSGRINLYEDNPPIHNGWQGVVAAIKPNCASFTTGIKDKIPSDKTLHLKFGSAKVVEIYNLKGKKVASYNVLGAEDKINVSLPSGVYIAKARGMQNVKFVVR